MDGHDVITDANGSLLEADVDALVNTVNTVGIMGKGLALQFKRAYPDMFRDYQAAAKRGDVALGRMHVWAVESLDGPRFVINFPTKRHWRSPSRLPDIERGLDDLIRIIRDQQISSIAVPPLGCGNGGLDWKDVGPLIRAKLAALPEVDVRLFAPAGAPPAAQMPARGAPPRMTPSRAALIETVARYSPYSIGGVTLIEVQKLMYFLQLAGEPLRLQFVRGHYGPYADNLRHTLADVEGHYFSGFGDGSRKVNEAEPLIVLSGARETAASELASHPETEDRIDRVLHLAEGFESPYSMELLATVHWIASQQPDLADDPQRIAAAVSAWSPRKERMFGPQHVRAAWEVLHLNGWLTLTELSDTGQGAPSA